MLNGHERPMRRLKSLALFRQLSEAAPLQNPRKHFHPLQDLLKKHPRPTNLRFNTTHLIIFTCALRQPVFRTLTGGS